MTKFLRSAALMVALAGGTAGVLAVTTNDSVAQEKGTKDVPKKGDKAEKDTPKKGDKEKGDKDKGDKEKAGKIEISEGKDMMFRFSVRNSEGKFLANSGANKFATKEEALKGVELFKAAVRDAKVEVLKD